MNTYIFLPPVRKPTGGITVLRQIADTLCLSGRQAFLVARDANGWQPKGLADVAPVLMWDEMVLGPEDLWLVPEGWANALAPGLQAKARCISYVQNWAYLFSSLPAGVQWHSLPVELFSVSEPVAQYVAQATGKPSSILRPGINREVFFPPDIRLQGPVRIAFMPRKNKALVAQIRALLEHRVGQSRVQWVEIQGMTTFEVAEALRSSHIFLMSGFPEGCPLPPLEAMACGCLPVGFSGYGGWDYMRQAQTAPRFTPWWPLREVSWEGNGLWAADGDVLDAALCLEQAVQWVEQADPALEQVLAAGQQTADAYSLPIQEATILALWKDLEEQP